jgi:hypothetical protein
LDGLKLDHELESLSYHEFYLTSHEASLEMERKNLEDAHLKVFSCELTTEVHEACLSTQAVELADRERQLVERQMQELAAA